MKLFSAFLIGLTISTSSFALDINEIAGQYKGTCKVTYTHTNWYGKVASTKTEEIEAALYVGKFTNVQDQLVDLAFSTELTSDDGVVPERLSFLLNADKKAQDYVAGIISEGLTGTDTNLGLLGSNNSRYNYTSENNETSLTVFHDLSAACAPGVACNPRELPACQGARNTLTNKSGYVGCKRDNDVTVVRKLSENKLESVRTANQYGGKNSWDSFVLPAISSVCVWEKQ